MAVSVIIAKAGLELQLLRYPEGELNKLDTSLR
jgi:hypothetical protein